MLMVRIKEVLEAAVFKKKIEASMGLQFMASLAAVISLLMILGTLFVQQMLVDRQYRDLNVRARELGLFLGKAGTDALLRQDLVAVDAMVGEAASLQDVLYVYIADDANRVVTNPLVSFNRSDPAMRAFLAQVPSQDVAAVASNARKAMDIFEQQAPIKNGTARIGTVVLGFSRAGIKRDAWNVVWLLLGTSIMIVMALSALVYWMVRRMIVIPTREAGIIASNIASGDLTHSVRVRSVDEFGMLGRGLNRMIMGLKGMIGKIRESARNMESVWAEVKSTSEEITSGSRAQSESVEEAASSVNEMHFSLKEIAGNVDDLHETSEQTSSSVIEMAASIDEVAKTMADLSLSIEDTSTAITQMSAAIRQIAENVEALSSAVEQTSASSTEISASVKEVESAARQSAALAEAVASDAQELGMRSIEKTIEGMGRIEANAQHSAEVVNRLGERAESIGSILTVIEDITDQTGLLALNAAILAAQAGEHGKGFAVVAAEIRELANRTATSTKEIGTLITSVQEETREAVDVMKEGGVIVEDGVRLAGNAGAALRKILERAGTSRDMSRSINRAAAEQSRGIRQVSEAVQQINKMAHQIANAANEQKTGSEQIMRAAEKMREMTRFVKSSTDEQAKAGKDITASMEEMSAKIGMVNRATGEVQAGSDLIVRSIDRIKEIAKANLDLAAGLNVAMDVMSRQSGALNEGDREVQDVGGVRSARAPGKVSAGEEQKNKKGAGP